MLQVLPFLVISSVCANDAAVGGTLQQRIAHRRGYLVPLNSHVTLSCPFETPFYKWTRPDSPSHFFEESKNLTINADSFDASGRYQCSAVNGFGNSLAEMAIRVVDYNSPILKLECALTRDGKINKAGPCFLKSYTDSELIMIRYWGEDVTFDCSSVTADGRTYQLNYAWEFYRKDLGKSSSSVPLVNRLTRSSDIRKSISGISSIGQENTSASVSDGSNGGASGGGVVGGAGSRAEVARFSEPQLTINKVTLSKMGEYKCIVTDPSPDSSSAAMPKIERTFQLHTIPRSEGAIIVGDHDITVHAKSGENLIQSCRVNAEQHRSITIRWGKIIDPSEAAPASKEGGKEIIRLSNIAFIVFPLMSMGEASSKLTSISPTVSSPFAVSDPGSPESQLVIQRVTVRDAGMYICSVITESGWDDRKLMRVVVSDSQTESSDETLEESSYPQRLALYIPAPMIVFFVCISIISYCLINRKGRRCSHLHGGGRTRATLPVMRQMGNSNNSLGVCRSGLNNVGLGGKTNTIGHHLAQSSQQRPSSSAVSASVNNNHNNNKANYIVYSSSTGSHSLSGTSTGIPGSMLLANTMVQVLPPDGSGYPILKPNGHRPHHLSTHNTYEPYNAGHMGGATGSGNASGVMHMPSAYRDFQT